MRPDRLIHDWNGTPSERRPVLLDDETLRDGLQSPSVRCPTIEQRLALWAKWAPKSASHASPLTALISCDLVAASRKE